jgi:anaerobic selenocysteine-containing dehydrogenase
LAQETIILPVLARDEEPQPTTQESMFNYVRLSDGGPRRHQGPKSEVEIIAHLADRVLGDEGRGTGDKGHKAENGEPLSDDPSNPSPSGRGKGEGEPAQSVSLASTLFPKEREHPASPNHQPRAARHSPPPAPIDWKSMRDTGKIRQAIAKVVPGFEAIENIDQTKVEFQIDGRTIHEPRFPLPEGKARLHVHELPDLQGGGEQLRLMTVRSEGQFNTVVYEDYDLYRGIDRRDVILLHPTDLARLGLESGQEVTVRGPAGSLSGVRATPFPSIKPGNALMYYPEANVLVPRTADPSSKTPAFNGVVVTVVATHARNESPELVAEK